MAKSVTLRRPVDTLGRLEGLREMENEENAELR